MMKEVHRDNGNTGYGLNGLIKRTGNADRKTSVCSYITEHCHHWQTHLQSSSSQWKTN